jgi:hypothetical protein
VRSCDSWHFILHFVVVVLYRKNLGRRSIGIYTTLVRLMPPSHSSVSLLLLSYDHFLGFSCIEFLRCGEGYKWQHPVTHRVSMSGKQEKGGQRLAYGPYIELDRYILASIPVTYLSVGVWEVTNC